MKKIIMMVAALAMTLSTSAQVGNAPDIKVEGNHLIDPSGNQVMLHGIMDTPSPYFCGYRFTDGHWIDVYNQGDNYIEKCKTYFNKLFTATTNTAQGSYCNVFRLHLDPCWTDNPNVKNAGFQEKTRVVDGKTQTYFLDPNGTEVTGEACTYHFDKTRLSNYLTKLYLPLAKLAKSHGMYVIMRPPGVCPQNVKVGDYYQQYLIDVWDIVSKSQEVKDNSGWLSIELANEPIGVLDASGRDTETAMRDFFQPIVDKIRSNGFKGIIWVPGKTWQQNYMAYEKNPVVDPLASANDGQGNLGYAVHFYPGWFSTSDSQYDPNTTIRAFLSSVPVVKNYPIMITEVDWSPENPNGTGHLNEYGQWVKPNYGTWATGSTSKFGYAYRAMLDYFGNVGMTLTHTHDYLDIDQYIATGQVRPAFTTEMGGNAYEACSGACFQWYKEYASKKIEARQWDNDDSSNEYFPLISSSSDPLQRVINPSIWETGSFDDATGTLVTGQYGFGGWQYSSPIDISDYKYLVIEFNKTVQNSGEWSPSFRMFDVNNYWSDNHYDTNLGGKNSVAIPLQNQKNSKGDAWDPSHIYIAGFWTLGGASNSISIKRIFLSDDGISPTGIEQTMTENADLKVVATFKADGSRADSNARGLVIQRMSNGSVRKVFVR